MDWYEWDTKYDDMETDDFSLALKLQEQFNNEIGESGVASNFLPRSTNETTTLSLIDPQWELIDPNPDIRALFLQYNERFFKGRLGGIEVKWSPRMTACAGICCYEGRGGLCSVRLSLPLLRLRPRKDLVETLLHEMIHAYLFVTDNNKDHDGHGPEFHKHMYRINKESGTKITVYHEFHDEVDSYRQHWWRCNGPCQQRRPYFGYVKRSMNRAPSPRDPWWGEHQRSCGGTYVKVKEPEGFGQKKKKRTESKMGTKISKDTTSKNTIDIRSFLSTKSNNASINQYDNKVNKEPKIKKLPNDTDSSEDEWISEDLFKDEVYSTPEPSKAKPSNSSDKWNSMTQNGQANTHTISTKIHTAETETKSKIPSMGKARIQTIWNKMETSDEDSASSSSENSSLIQTINKTTKQHTAARFTGVGHTLGVGEIGLSFLALERKILNMPPHCSSGSQHHKCSSETEIFKRKIESKNSLVAMESESDDDSSAEVKPLIKRIKSSVEENGQKMKQSKDNAKVNSRANVDIRTMMSPGKSGSSVVEPVHPCPVCKTRIPDSQINSHLDQCLVW